jgi:hypothetical protein
METLWNPKQGQLLTMSVLRANLVRLAGAAGAVAVALAAIAIAAAAGG